ncbi:alpha-L-rhamnosidase [Emticicia oligotrophica DSM 17448]|uniref:Alpha-L-rhamnosidase n=1 Tax=Emticicia oligotrophica (strain DSM 17448 / CIP 109782 / MTCC 6937 / GPTSA100-15) TaxID=929562 RepID=A0ABM5N0W1_EMTOG|nr:family 78 glycoside hydrolase catalytic domain [Emticicia oligotrophica]AFK03063.1 alpha-L-rhamnosidase [Emticicia oligotrophica DSM 17448]
MRKTILVLFSLLITQSLFSQTLEKLRCEYQETPFGLEVTKPRLSWQMKATTRGAKQTAYQILVADSEAELKKDNGNVWNSGMVKSDQSLKIEYAGKPLESRKRYFWKVKVWNEKNKPTLYSEASWWEMALLKKEDWSAHWIGKNSTEGKAIELQKEFNLGKRATRARIYVSGIGAYHLIFNGKKVGQDYLTPGLLKDSKMIPYQIYEVSNEDLSIGINFITATLGNGWQKGNQLNKLLFQMEMEFYDGSRQTVISDGSWKTRLSPIISNNVYGGEVYNAQLEYGKDWENAALMDEPQNSQELKPLISPQIQIIKEIKAVKITEPRKGRYVFDFGQNIVGFVYLQTEGKATKEVELKYAETLTEKGLVEQKGIKPTDKYLLKGYGIEKWEPKFTFHGFRYVEVEGLPKKADENTLLAKVIYENNPFVENLAYTDEFIQKRYTPKSVTEPNFNENKTIISASLSTESKVIDTNYGQISAQSNLQGNKFSLKLSVPANQTVQVQLPLIAGKSINNIKEGGKFFVVKKKPVKIEGITYLKSEKDKAIFEVGSGNYELTIE